MGPWGLDRGSGRRKRVRKVKRGPCVCGPFMRPVSLFSSAAPRPPSCCVCPRPGQPPGASGHPTRSLLYLQPGSALPLLNLWEEGTFWSEPWDTPRLMTAIGRPLFPGSPGSLLLVPEWLLAMPFSPLKASQLDEKLIETSLNMHMFIPGR